MQNHLNMLVVKAQDREDGMYLVLVPEGLDEAQMRSGFDEIGLKPADVYEVSDWQTSKAGVAAVFLPYFQSAGR
ncbi:MAG: hypothetical protein RBS80_26075 [Thermoguttaceae bacterium]|jgi:hypothetical protein|nr:hypothetical protein [Thermoguttaceae bacterium]